MEKIKIQEKDLNEVKREVIKIGSIGILIFAIAIGGAILFFYLGKTPEYAILRRVILLISVIIFIIGLVILYFFKLYVEMYFLIRDYDKEEDDE